MYDFHPDDTTWAALTLSQKRKKSGFLFGIFLVRQKCTQHENQKKWNKFWFIKMISVRVEVPVDVIYTTFFRRTEPFLLSQRRKKKRSKVIKFTCPFLCNQMELIYLHRPSLLSAKNF